MGEAPPFGTLEITLAKKKSSARAFKGRRSKVEPFAAIVGTVSDKEVARRAGVSSENVRTWRKRRGIAASWKEGGADPVAASAAPVAALPEAAVRVPKKGKSRKKPRRRRSKIDPFRKELGQVPDRTIAERSGTSIENVRAYRRRHGIEAEWQRSSGIAVSTPAPAPASVQPGRAPAPKRARTSASNWAYRVTAEVGGAEKEYVTFGADIAEAAQVAKDRLALNHKDAFVQKIEVLGVAL